MCSKHQMSLSVYHAYQTWNTPSGARTLDTLIKSQVHAYTYVIVCATVAHSAVMGCMSTWA